MPNIYVWRLRLWLTYILWEISCQHPWGVIFLNVSSAGSVFHHRVCLGAIQYICVRETAGGAALKPERHLLVSPPPASPEGLWWRRQERAGCGQPGMDLTLAGILCFAKGKHSSWCFFFLIKNSFCWAFIVFKLIFRSKPHNQSLFFKVTMLKDSVARLKDI